MLNDKETLKAKYLLWCKLNNVGRKTSLCLYCRLSSEKGEVPDPLFKECYVFRNVLWFKDKFLFDYEAEKGMPRICLAFLQNNELYRVRG